MKRDLKTRRHKRIRAKIFGTAGAPRLSVFRSNKHIYCQLINDETGKILVIASDLELNKKQKSNKTIKRKIKAEEKKDIRKGKISTSYQVGRLIAQKALEKKIKKTVFDRGGYKYHGRVKALAEGAREGGLIF